jgi:hypothetical protein
MEIHAFSGFTQNDNLVRSRTAGVLAGLLETYPEMTWDDVLQWCKENGIPDWVPNIDTDDSQADRLIGGEYAVMFDERYPWTSEAQSNFVSWAKGYDIGKLPPIQTASPAIQQAFTEPVISSQPAPQQSAPVDDWDFFQSQNEDTTLQPAATPTPASTYTQSPAPVVTPTPAPTMVPYPKPSTAKEGSSNMLLIVGGIIAAYMLMKRKK